MPTGAAPARARWTLVRPAVALPPVVFGVLLLGTWEAVTRTGAVAPFFLPAPGTVAQAFGEAVTDGDLLEYTWQTVVESAAGSGLGVAVALPLGYLVARSTLASRTLQPYIAASQAVPAVAIAPLLALWAGYGLLPIAILCALLVFFPMLVNTVLGLRELDRDVLNAARVDGVGRWGMLRHIEFPLALPSILAGVRTGCTLSITGAVVGEFVMGGEGLGQLLAVQRGQADTTGLFVTLLTLVLLAAVTHGTVRLAERAVAR
ncbi:ABC transporter permease [Streptomyces incarnatus]|uniref:ABC transporter permease n=1 Tax=Streptomyces incarnatus TaxID=665007 RepID=A0ABM5TH03_9ACTN|nr:ABC transporter permease [Streptomyces incarnatus]